MPITTTPLQIAPALWSCANCGSQRYSRVTITLPKPDSGRFFRLLERIALCGIRGTLVPALGRKRLAQTPKNGKPHRVGEVSWLLASQISEGERLARRSQWSRSD